MAQYFTPIFLDAAGRITAAIDASDYGTTLKLFSHTRAGTPLLDAVTLLLALDGGSRLVWAGDYAETETNTDANLYFAAEDRHFVRFADLVDPGYCTTGTHTTPPISPADRRYVCNPGRREYIDTAGYRDEYAVMRNPLPLLTAETGSHATAGPWSREHIYATGAVPGPDWDDITQLQHLG